MTRLLSVAAAVAGLMIAPAAFAQGGTYYNAVPVAAPAKNSVITSGTLWKCTGPACSAPKSTQRDAIMCQLVVQRIGALKSFSVNGQPFGAAELAECNSRAG
ncbi:MAG: hypothetical protein K2X73_02095 [Sphingomonas sp.]|jgi:hypothetical protein|uniref:CC_3452 family protein n=1 Tax=Sphingomonas sp. TaxID=28214 RepID=UPI0025D129A9|nr:hypothetical protein [Sphingomonas sp.]MBX9880744.1 hypothetical protein [Sphingomonas sp.]